MRYFEKMKYLFSLVFIFLSLFLFFLWFSRDPVQSILKNFEKYAEEQQREWRVQGMAIGIIKDDKIILVKGYGQRGMDDKQPVDENTIFQIGSLTKAFTSALVSIGVDKKWLKWDDTVIEHMPEFHLDDSWVAAQFQIQDLLAQRSGLPAYSGDSQALFGFTAEDMMHHLNHFKSSTSFRSQYAYQNIFFVVAGHILEAKSKIDYSNLLKLEIFTPLGMTSSSTTLEEYSTSENRAEWLIHEKNGTIFHLKEDSPEANWSYIFGPAGGINSNIKDMANWMILQANQGKFKDQQIISSDNMKRMTRPMIFAGSSDEGINSYNALGWVHRDYSPYPIIWHNGSTLGAYNAAAFIPEEKLGIVILTNGRNTLLASALVFQFFDMYYGKADQNWSQKLLAKVKEELKKTPPKVENPSPPMPLSSYAGEYQNPAYGKAVVKEVNRELHLIMGKNNKDYPLKPWDRDIFTMSWAPIEEDEIKVHFIQGDDGKIEQMEIDILMEEGCGEFEKKSPEETEKAKSSK